MRVVQGDLYSQPPPRPERDAGGISRRALFGFKLGARARADIPYDAVGERRRAGWDRDGHEPWLRAIEPAARMLVEAAGVQEGDFVLDAGAGDGNVTAAALAVGADVDAVELSEPLEEAGAARCASAAWSVGDVQDLPYEEDMFDVVLSGFGATFAPRAKRTARELVRVCRPGGTVGLTAWVPKGLPGRFPEVVEAIEPLPDGIRSPADWGVQARVTDRLGPLLEHLELRLRTIQLTFDSPGAFFDALARPHVVLDDPENRARAREAFDALLASCNNSTTAVEVDARLLLILGRRPE